jgi:hypothetical protein
MQPTTMKVPSAALNEHTFDKTVGNPTSSVYSDASQELTTPYIVRIAHETSKSGKIRNSVIIFEKKVEDSVTGEIATIKAQFKVSYDLQVVESADLEAVVTDLIATLATGDGSPTSDEFSISKFLNAEH